MYLQCFIHVMKKVAISMFIYRLLRYKSVRWNWCLNWPFVFIIHCYLDHSINSYLFPLCHKQKTNLIVTTCMVWFFCLQKNSNNFGIAGLALFQWGWCGANVYLKVLGSAATSGPRGVVSLGVISPASREAESPSQLLSLSLSLHLFLWYVRVFTPLLPVDHFVN